MSLFKKILRIVALSVLISAIIVAAFYYYSNGSISIADIFNKATVASRLAQYGDAVDLRLRPLFDEKKVKYPPNLVKIVFIKDEKLLKLYAGNSQSDLNLIKSYPVLAASGKQGPKLVEGDRQVPEGVYKVESLNPNSLFHLSLKVNYPNSFDKAKAAQDGRTNLGGDIMIHGKNSSVGCIAIGDSGIEELFVLAAKTNYRDWELVLAPTDLMSNERAPSAALPIWIKELDRELQKHLKF